jgi:hypothetical protein
VIPVAPSPPALAAAGARPFSFHPPIANIAPNDWIYIRCTWAEVLVANESTGEEIAIPRHWIGGLRGGDESGLGVELLARLEYSEGVVRREDRRLIVMPTASAEAAERQGRAAVVPIRLEGRLRSRPARIAAAALAIGLAGCVLLAYLYRGEIVESRHSIRTSARGF